MIEIKLTEEELDMILSWADVREVEWDLEPDEEKLRNELPSTVTKRVLALKTEGERTVH